MSSPLPPNESLRLDALHRYEVLDSAGESEFDDLAALASQICGTSMALISLVDAHRQWFKSKVGIEVSETPRGVAFCAHTILGDDVLEIPNALEDDRFKDSSLVTTKPDVRFYAGAPLKSSDGHNLGALCVMDCVPRRLRSEQRDALRRLARQAMAQLELRLVNRQLTRQAAFQDSILEHASAVIVTTAEGAITHFNAEAEQIFGYAAKEVRGKSPLILHDQAEVAERARELAGEFGRDIRADFETINLKAAAGPPETREWICVRKNGTRFPVRLRVSALRDDAGVLAGFLCTARDITDRRRAETERDRFFNLALDMLCIANVDGYFMRVNPAFTTNLGWSAEELVSRPYLDFVHPEDKARTAQKSEDLLAGQPVTHFENRYHCKDGTWKILSWRALSQPDGTIYASARDVTSERNEEDLRTQHRAQTERFQRTLLRLRDYEGRDLAGFFAHVTSSVAAALQVARVSVWLFEEDRTAISCQHLHCLNAQEQDGSARLTAADYPRYFEAATRRHPIVADDAHTHEATREFSRHYLTVHGISSMLDIPILQDSQLRGVLCHEHTGPPRKWASEEVKFATSVANCVTIALEQVERRAAEVALRDLNATLELRVSERTAALQESEARFRQLAEGIDCTLWITGKETDDLTYVSPAYEKIWGRTVESLKEKPMGWVEAIHPEDRSLVLEAKQQIRQPSGRAFEIEYRIMRPSGEIRYIRDRGFPICNQDGKLVRAVGIADDITEQIKAEREIRQALMTLDATEDGAFIFEPDSLRYTYVNQGAKRQLGFTDEELLKMTPLDVAFEFDEESFRKIMEPMLRGESHTQRFTTLHRRKDGLTLPVEINLQYIKPEGEQPRFIAIVRDISERRRMEQQASRSQRLEAIGTLAGGVAHDLNNALAPIMMGVEGLKRKYPSEKALLEIFESSAGRASDMVRQLLSFAKGAEGERVAIQPLHLIKEIQKILKGTFPKNIRLNVECEQALPTLLGDATQLHQILLNLCVNSRDAMPNGGTLHITARRQYVDEIYASSVSGAKPGLYMLLQVRDTGTGIPPDVLERIFDPFFTTKGQDKGTGLGLSTVMGIVKGHAGFLQVYSEVGAGSTFSVYLPTTCSGETAAPDERKMDAFQGNGETILLVDDEESFREVGSRVLAELNFNVVTATDGTDGLMKVAERRSELRAIITDQHMPHMDGLSFVRALRRALPGIPVAVGSGRLDESIAEEFKALGVTQQLDKPYTQDRLTAALKAMLGDNSTLAA